MVMIDEAFLSRRKYNKGRVKPTNRIFVLGGSESEKLRVRKRSVAAALTSGKRGDVSWRNSMIAPKPPVRSTFKNECAMGPSPGRAAAQAKSGSPQAAFMATNV